MPTNLHPTKPRMPLGLSIMTFGLPSALIKNKAQKKQQQTIASQVQSKSNQATNKQPI